MLSGEGNAEERWKTTIGIISKKKQLCTCRSLILYISLPSFCTRQRETSRNLFNSCTFYGGIVVRVLVHFFLSPLIFILHWWPLAFLILPHRRYKTSMLFFQQKKCLLRLFSLASDLCLSPALYSKFVDMLDNESKLNTLDNTDTETISAFHFRLYWLWLCFARRR